MVPLETVLLVLILVTVLFNTRLTTLLPVVQLLVLFNSRHTTSVATSTAFTAAAASTTTTTASIDTGCLKKSE